MVSVESLAEAVVVNVGEAALSVELFVGAVVAATVELVVLSVMASGVEAKLGTVGSGFGVVAPHRTTVSLKEKRWKMIEGESLKCSIYSKNVYHILL